MVLDEVALPAGQLRVRSEGSAGGHNGLKSIIGVLGTQQFARLRIGVGRGDPRRDLADHVLSPIGPDLRPIVDEAVVKAAAAVECFARDGIEKTMQVFNAPAHPYTQALLSAIPKPDPQAARAEQRIVLSGDLPNPLSPPSGCPFRTRCFKATDYCAEVEPELIPRNGTTHLSACHYAESAESIEAPEMSVASN